MDNLKVCTLHNGYRLCIQLNSLDAQIVFSYIATWTCIQVYTLGFAIDIGKKLYVIL